MEILSAKLTAATAPACRLKRIEHPVSVWADGVFLELMRD